MLTRRTAFTRIAMGGAPFALAACATQPPEASGLVTQSSFAAWLDRYKQAWEERDAQQAGGLFTEDAIYHEMPFDAPMHGRAAIEAYWARVTAGQADVHFTYEVLACAGAQGVAHWHAAFKSVPGGQAIDLDGIFVCEFADARTVRALKEWWHIRVAESAG
jgi:ketosteroid isomerase-like protein